LEQLIGWIPLISEDQLLAIKQASHQQPVMIFKHSTSCSTSAMVLDRFERKWQGDELGDLSIYFLDLLRYRSISDQISIDFDLRHESPQLLVVEGGLVTYHDSHFGIDYQELLTYLKKD
tara:strand:- start:1162 stop:1518 length:357 start_codon:yes stop_codon:yes gene_type:complete